MRLIICDPMFVADATLELGSHVAAPAPPSQNRFLKAFIGLANGGDARIHLINGRFQDMAIALPDLVGETDRERHALRMMTLRTDTNAAA